MHRVRVASVLLLSLTTSVWCGDGLLRNGGFEENAKRLVGWTFTVWSNKPSRGTFKWATDAREGKRAARLVGVENAGEEAVRYLLYSAPMDVSAGLFKFRGWVRTTGDGRASIQILLYDQDFSIAKFGKRPRRTISHAIPKSSEWAPFDFSVDVGQGVKQAVILLRGTDIGEVDYDDVSLTRIDDALVLRLYPAEYGRANTVHLLRDAPNFVHFALIGDRRRITRSAEILLDLPEGVSDFELLGASTPLARDGKPYRRFRLTIAQELLARLRRAVSHCYLTIWLDGAETPPRGTMYYRPVVDGQELGEKQAEIVALPPLPAGPRPRRFHSLFCWGTFSVVPEKLYGQVHDLIRSMGIDYHLARVKPRGWSEYLQGRVREDGGQLWANIPHSIVKAMRKKGWETRITTKGKSYFEIGGDYYRQLARSIDGVFWDWEPANAMRNPLWDDPATVAAFAQKEGLDEGTLTTERLKGELRERYLGFRTWQLSQVVRLWAQYVHDLRPDLTIGICQGSGMPPDRHVDYRAYNDIPRLVHLPMIYTSSAMGFAKNVAGMREYLPKAALFPMTSTGMVVDSGWTANKPARHIYFHYVSSALLGSIGCSHWPDLRRGFDMEYVWEVARAMRDIACVEPFLFDGERNPQDVSVVPLPENEARIKTAKGEVVIASPQWDRSALCFAHRLEGRTLVSVCNMHTDKPATVRVRVGSAEGEGWHVHDPVTKIALVQEGRTTWPGEALKGGLLYEVPADSLGMLVIAREAPTEGLKGRIVERDVRTRFETRRAAAKAAGDLTSLRAGNLEINWADLDGDGSAEVRLASQHHELGIGPSGNLWSWRVHGRDGDLVSRFDGGGACQDQFWWPEEARASQDKGREYEMVTREIKGGRATVVFRRALSHYALGGLIIEKSYTVTEEAPRFAVRVNLRNESPEPHEFSYWSHNCFRVGPTPTLTITTKDGERTFAGDQQPREVWAARPGLPADQAALIAKPDCYELADRIFTLGNEITVRTDLGGLLQLYRWWDGTKRGQYTLEWMYRKQTLVTGQMWTTRFIVEATKLGER